MVQRLRASLPHPVCDMFELHSSTQHVSQFRRFHFLTFCLSPLPLAKSLFEGQTRPQLFPFHDIFVPQKVPLSKVSDDVIVCDLWFAPPQSKTLAMHMIYEVF